MAVINQSINQSVGLTDVFRVYTKSDPLLGQVICYVDFNRFTIVCSKHVATTSKYPAIQVKKSFPAGAGRLVVGLEAQNIDALLETYPEFVARVDLVPPTNLYLPVVFELLIFYLHHFRSFQ